MKRVFFLLTHILCFSASFALSVPSVVYKGNPDITVDPQNKVTLVFMVTNTTGNRKTYMSDVVIPPGWQVLAGNTRFDLGPGETDVRLVTVFVPRESRAGSYQVRFLVGNVEDRNEKNESEVTIRVNTVEKILLKLIESPGFVIGGEPYNVSLFITNGGNTSVPIVFTVNSTDQLPCTVLIPGDVKPLLLAPGESKPVYVKVDTSKVVSRHTYHYMEIIASEFTPVKPEKPFEAVRVSTRVEIIPKQSESFDLFIRYPFLLDFKASGGADLVWNGDASVTLRGSGALDEAGEHILELKLNKKVDSYGNVLVNLNDEYRLRYHTPWYDFLVGDFGYSVSPLLENYRYGRGLKADGKIGPFSLGAYYHQTYYLDPVPQYAAMHGGFRLFDEDLKRGYSYSVDLNAFSTLDENLLFGIRQTYQPVESLNLELDLATGSEFGSTLDYGSYFRLTGDSEWIYYNCDAYYAGPGFPGFYSDQYFGLGTLGMRFLDRRLSVSTTFHAEQKNLLLDPLEAAPFVWDIQFGAGYFFEQLGPGITLNWKLQSQDDLRPTPEYRYVENIVSAEYVHPFDPFYSITDVQIGWRMSELDSGFLFSHQYGSMLEWRPDPFSFYRFGVLYDSRIDTMEQDSHKIGWTLDSSNKIESFVIGGRLANDYFFDERGLEWMTFAFGATFFQTFLNRHTLDVRADVRFMYIYEQWNNTFNIQVNYTMPADIPLAHKQSIGKVKGLLTDNADQSPLHDVIVHLDGRAFITDEDGSFIFAPVSPGRHFIDLDLTKLGPNRIPIAKTPIEVNVEHGRETVINIAITRGAVVEGTVGMYGYKNDSTLENHERTGSELVASGGVQNAILELANGTDTKRRISDDLGRFAFDELLPGAWTLKVIIPGLPESHVVEKETFEIVLGPEQTEVVRIRIVPKQRTLLMLEDTGSLTIETIEKTPEPKRIPGETPGTAAVVTPEPKVDDARISPIPTPEPAAPTPVTILPTPEPQTASPVPAVPTPETVSPTPEPQTVSPVPAAPTPETVSPTAELQTASPEPAAPTPVTVSPTPRPKPTPDRKTEPIVPTDKPSPPPDFVPPEKPSPPIDDVPLPTETPDVFSFSGFIKKLNTGMPDMPLKSTFDAMGGGMSI